MDNRYIEKKNSITKKRIKLSIIPAIILLFFIWLMFVIDYLQVVPFNFSLLGIYPLRVNGLGGIVLSPFIHASFSHLASNTVPLLIMVSMVFYFYNQIAIKSISLLWLLSGSFTWIIGRSAYHIGASGLVFALVFFLFFSGLLRKYIPLVAVSMIVIFIYGSTIWSIFPISELVDVSLSWEAHLSGAIAGFIVAFIYRKQGPQKPEVVWHDDEVEAKHLLSDDFKDELKPTAYIDWENITIEDEVDVNNNFASIDDGDNDIKPKNNSPI